MPPVLACALSVKEFTQRLLGTLTCKEGNLLNVCEFFENFFDVETCRHFDTPLKRNGALQEMRREVWTLRKWNQDEKVRGRGR
jgi:hypothetical protein